MLSYKILTLCQFSHASIHNSKTRFPFSCTERHVKESGCFSWCCSSGVVYYKYFPACFAVQKRKRVSRLNNASNLSSSFPTLLYFFSTLLFFTLSLLHLYFSIHFTLSPSFIYFLFSVLVILSSLPPLCSSFCPFLPRYSLWLSEIYWQTLYLSVSFYFPGTMQYHSTA